MRPHNKSTLWDEYLEHYDKHKKYFNTKHKKAFCRRCIAKEVANLDNSPEARRAFEATDFVEGWPEWKYRRAFDKVEAISGRSSNMQRHIRTCSYISTEDRSRIMANFEASQSSRSSKEPDFTGIDDAYSNIPRATAPPPASSSPWATVVGTATASPPNHYRYHGQPSVSGRSRATSNSDDDAMMTPSSFSSPDLARREITRSTRSQPRPSPRLTLRSILNEDSDTPSYPYPYSSSSSSNSPRSKAVRGVVASGSEGHGLIAGIAMNETQYVQTRLEDRHHAGSQHPHGNGVSDNGDSVIALLRRENELLKRRCSSMKNDNGELKARLDRERRFNINVVESNSISSRMSIASINGGGREENGESNEFKNFRTLTTPRANSTPVLVPMAMKSEMLKKRKLGETGAVGFSPTNK